MMNRRNRIAGRVALWNLKTTAGFTVLLSLTSFLLVYLYARGTSYHWQPVQLFTVYLGGFRRVDIFAVLWIAVHVPIQIRLTGQLMNIFNKAYPVRVLKYQNKMAFCRITFTTLIMETMIYYAVGYGVLIAFTGGKGVTTALWQAGLCCIETLNIVSGAFFLGQLFRSWENLAYPAVLVVEFFNTLISGSKEGNARMLPFTQAKLAVQGGSFYNGTALAASLITLGCLILIFVVLWKRKDERNDF